MPHRFCSFSVFVLMLVATGCSETGAAPPELPPMAAAPTAPATAAPASLGAAGAMPQTAAGSDAAPPVMTAPEQAPAQAAEPAAPTMQPAMPQMPRPPGWQELSHAKGAKPDYARLFADAKVQRIDIEMSAESKRMMDADLEKLLGPMPEPGAGFPWGGGMMGMMGMMRDPTMLYEGEPIYVPVTVRYDGGVWTKVAMRLKGNSSLASAYRMGIQKYGFRLDFDRYEMEHPETLDQRFYGFGKMTFSSAFRDPSLIRDKLAADILSSLGMVSARCAFYRVYVDAGAGPVYWGLYTMIEDPSDQLVEAQFADKSGNLYKPDGPGADWRTPFTMEAFEKKSNEDKADFSDVMAAVSALHAARTDAATWRAGLEARFNVKRFLDVLAFSRATGHWDGYGVMAHNYYLYADPTDMGRLLWISWDHNLSLQQNLFGGGLTVMMDEITEQWPLIRFLLDDPVYRMQYQESLRAALGGLYEKAKFEAHARQLHTLVSPYVIGGAGETGEKAPYTFITEPDQFRNALTEPGTGMLEAAEALRQAVRTALMMN